MPPLLQQFPITLRNKFKDRVTDALLSFSDSVREIILETYNDELLAAKVPKESKANPAYLYDEFLSRLNSFEMLDKSGDKFEFIVPDVTTFDFSGELSILKTILEGTVGVYVEVTDEQYVEMYHKRPVNLLLGYKGHVAKENVYLVRYTPDVRKREKDSNIKLVRFPFSNTPPIGLFEPANEYVENNLSKVIHEAIDKAIIEVTK